MGKTTRYILKELIFAELILKELIFCGTDFHKSLHKLVLPETVFISYFWGMEMYKMGPKVVYLAILANFSSQTHSKALYTTNEVHLRAHVFTKVSTN